MNVSIERLEEIEIERSKVIANPAFQLWMRELNVSPSWSDPEPLFNAREMNNQYDFGKNKVARLEFSTYL
jgi:hypothetical protein